LSSSTSSGEMMARYAKVKDGRVWSVVLWDGVAPWKHIGFDVVALPEDSAVSTGWLIVDGAFVAPPVDEEWSPPYEDGLDA
jgi:hypothetical protein